MKLSEAVKPISYIKAHASEVLREIEEKGAFIITINGEAKAVLQDIREYEKTQESLAMLKILSQSRKSIEERKVSIAKAAFRNIREKIRELDENP